MTCSNTNCVTTYTFYTNKQLVQVIKKIATGVLAIRKIAHNAAMTEIRKSNTSYEQKLPCNIKNGSKSSYAFVGRITGELYLHLGSNTLFVDVTRVSPAR